MRTLRPLAALAATAALLLTGACSASKSPGGQTPSGFTPPRVPMRQSLGAGEGSVDVVAWAGYVEYGQDSKTVDWVTPFTKATGCKVNLKVAGTSDEMVALMKTGQYDTVSASGDATLRLIAGGDVAPVNTKLVPNYATVYPGLKNQPWNSVGGVPYGIPHGRGANLLMYNTAKVTPAPTSWGAVFDPNSPYKGHLTAYDDPIYIADAALYLMKTKPSLGIRNPYALTADQLNAAVTLLKDQKPNVNAYWSDYTKEQASFDSGDFWLGTTWEVIQQAVAADGKVKTAAILPSEGSTGWSDTWMVSAHAQHPNCAYEWMNYIVSPSVNAQVAEYFGEAPANSQACGYIKDNPNFCADYHANDESWWRNVYYWNTPTRNCVDGSGRNDCTDYAQWVTAWNEIKS
ncbi:spermidine/putrescine ABC transporter substrate-binding protein [Streptacidiphilus pinicola]|uniref:Spermidine/putrescine ABC transporter substrate-binding protein n=1 Tax=Streptacidiphilus pinicola TaxID=2219663 RepID=A0A2X0IHD5_9ACTN|nr:ABC transporter substrate-binding protein [Streptacidiphilus pinicola]RAG84464.1 spermidine/putrescine ABC transporter substrate-binding protein [Streptacidiphilus pinicola]